MISQTLKLIRLQMRKTLGLNEVFHGKDNRRSIRAAALLILYLLLALMFMGYAAGAAMLMCLTGLGEQVPGLMVTLACLCIFLFSLFKAGPVLFDQGDLDLLRSLPLHPGTILISRFFTLYAGNFALCAAASLPVCLVYTVMMKPGAGFVPAVLLALPFLPLIPLVAAGILGTALTALGARLAFKKALMAFLALAGSLAIVCFSFSLSAYSEVLDNRMLAQFIADAAAWLGQLYLPAVLLEKGLTRNNAAAYAAFILLSLGIFVLFVLLVGRFFDGICNACKDRAGRSRFRFGQQQSRSLWAAVYFRELRRYFSSNIYVMNTMIGYLMLLAGAVALTVIGREELPGLMGLAEAGAIPESVTGLLIPDAGAGGDAAAWALCLIRRLLPCLMVMIACLGNTTPVSLSMEGKQLWLIRSLPVPTGTLFLGKVLVNLTLAVPSVLVSALILAVGRWMEDLWLVVLPLCYVIFDSFLGIWINGKMPVFDWHTETEAVKQSLATFIAMLVPAFGVLPAAAAQLFLAGVLRHTVLFLLSALLLSGSVLAFNSMKRYRFPD